MLSIDTYAQVNAYAKVTAISGNVLTLSNVNETYHTFEDGDEIIIMQMQDNVIGDVTNASTFGVLGSIQSAGLYEVKRIQSHTESGGLPATITVNNAITNTFNINSNATVQIISYRLYGSPDYTTTANMVALDWDGNVGGVLAIRVNGVLTLAHSLTANAAGFLGGARSSTGGTVTCATTTWITTSSSGDSGRKGEGIYKNTSSSYVAGRAKILNGGGGGNIHNGGGAGGGNYAAGGDGGPGYLCTSTPVGGQGGISLSSYINSTRVFMGGGGGGGHQNNGVGSAGADGGGIVLIKANSITTSGSCGSITISANGGAALNSNNGGSGGGNDGAGGGGAGGSIIMDVSTFSVAPGCTLSVAASGGNGGSVTDAAIHAGGGGGSQGVVIYSSAQPTSNVTTTTASGTGGCNNSSCSSSASTASGTANSGIVSNAGTTPLPVSLLYFKGLYNSESKAVELRWATASEHNNDHFTIERSANGEEFETIATVKGNGTISTASKYQYIDDQVRSGIYYYRLSQTDLDGTTVRFDIIRIELDGQAEPFASIYPNPANRGEQVTVDLIDVPAGAYSITIMDTQGIEVAKAQLSVSQSSGTATIESGSILSGIYIVRIVSPAWQVNRKLIIH
ncbi:MAG TPA: T9SS type A sorting domain-containing protein [Ohtaekwangia sp.]|uniref:T9SS type A sorting domain-containing protein n=1 Tax=Ohtaekwangia sp. TaxID=2066019 RepID=UPI002F932B0C